MSKGEKEYVSCNSGICAKCGADIEDWSGNEIDGMEVHYFYTCPVCGGAGCETYTIEFETNTVIIDEE